MPASTKTNGTGPRFIDVHHHCVLPEYQAALVRSGAADPSKPLRKNASPQEAIVRRRRVDGSARDHSAASKPFNGLPHTRDGERGTA